MDTTLIKEFQWDAEKLFKWDGEKWVRFIDEPWTADGWWAFQVRNNIVREFGLYNADFLLIGLLVNHPQFIQAFPHNYLCRQDPIIVFWD